MRDKREENKKKEGTAAPIKRNLDPRESSPHIGSLFKGSPATFAQGGSTGRSLKVITQGMTEEA